MTRLSPVESANLRLIRQANRILNVIRGSASESKSHFTTKCEICYRLMCDKKKFVTEAIFDGKGRADVFDITSGIIYEVVHSESDISLAKKKALYPDGISLIIVKAGEISEC